MERGVQASQVAAVLTQETEMQVPSLGGEEPLEEGMAPTPAFYAWKIPWTEEPGRPWGRKESDMTGQD